MPAELTDLLDQMDEISREISDGHWTLMSFTANYKAFFGSITSLDTEETAAFFDAFVPSFPDPASALAWAVEEKVYVWDVLEDALEQHEERWIAYIRARGERLQCDDGRPLNARQQKYFDEVSERLRQESGE